METREFLKWLLPHKGVIVLGLEPISGGWKQVEHLTIDDAADAMLEADKTGKTNVYMSVNRFKSTSRKQGNVAACRAIFDDYDVKPGTDGHYQDKPEALRDIIKLSKALQLSPTIVDSGGGFHVYYHLDDDIDENTWNELSELKRTVTKHLELKVDRQCDTDSARVLRAPGTHNYKPKYGKPLPVKLVKQGKTYAVDKIRTALDSYIEANPAKMYFAEQNDNKWLSSPYKDQLDCNFCHISERMLLK